MRNRIDKIWETFKKHGRADCSLGTNHKYWKTIDFPGQSKMHSVQRRIQNTVKHLK